MEEALVVALGQAERQVQSRLGRRKLMVVLAPELAAAGVAIGRDRWFKVLGARGLLGPRRPREFVSTTQSGHYLPVLSNLIKGMELTHPNAVWVSDLT